MNKKLLIEIANLKKLALRCHDTCDDPWYSCPKSKDGCSDESKGTNCTCGVDSYNKKVQECYDELIKCLIQGL